MINFFQKTFSLFFASIFLFLLAIPSPVNAAEIGYIQAIKDRGYIKVGLPPYTTPPFYYNDKKSGQLLGYDVEIATNFADQLGVEVQFDRDSKSFNDLVRRAGAGDFDLGIGKLGTTYKRMSDAHPHEYMNFRHALLARRKSIASVKGQTPDDKFAKVLLDSKLKIGFIKNSAYDTFANRLFPNAEKIGYKNWGDCKKALLNNEVDAIYRDATEIKKIVYQRPTLSLTYVPVLFEDIIDQKSIYLSTKAEQDLGSILDYFLSREVSIKSDSEIMADYSSFYQPIKDSKPASSSKTK